MAQIHCEAKLWALATLCVIGLLPTAVQAASIQTQSNPVVAGTITVASGSPTRGGWSDLPTYAADGSDRAAPNNYTSVQVANDNDELYMRFLMSETANYGFRHNVMIDVDQSHRTGFIGTGSGHLAMGVDYLIQGSAIFRFAATTQTGWLWEYVDSIKFDTEPNDIAISVPRSALGDVGGAFDFALWANNFDLGRDEDYYPNSSYLPGGAFFTYEMADLVGIDELTLAVFSGSTNSKYDLNGDGQVNDGDREYWVKDLQGTHFGDANLDLVIDSEDLIQVFQAGEYEDGIAGNSVWATGDWTGDLEFTSDDLIYALQDTGSFGAVAAVSAVPEPNSLLLLIMGGASLWAGRRRK